MNTGKRLGRGIVTAVVLLLASVGAHARPAPLTAKELVENTRLKNHRQELENGDIVILKQPEKEGASQLNVFMALLVPAALQKTVDTLRRQAAEDAPGVIASGEVTTSKRSALNHAFAGVRFTSRETDEVERLMSGDAWRNFNFSRDEIALINQRSAEIVQTKPDSDAAISAMSGAMRDVLIGRYLAYRQKGLRGLEPYRVSDSKQIDSAAELIAATEDLDLVRERLPAYFDCLRYYPDKQAAGLVHQFFWVKQMESGRPLFLLKHWILDVRPDYALITERQFYLDHSLNSLQVVIGCLPHGDRTLVVLLNQAFTEKVNRTVGKSIAKAIGYKQVEKNIRPIFEDLRTALSR